MEDLRRRNNINNLNNKMKVVKVFTFLNKNWVKILLWVVVISVLFFPEFTGNLVGEWLNTLINSFSSKITF